MKKIFAKFISLISALSIMLATTGCSDDKDVVYGKDDVNITFSWWGSDNRNSYTLDGVDAFEELNDSISVSCKYSAWKGYSKRQNIYMKSLNVPDVMQINFSWLKDYSPDGNGFYDLSQLSDYIDFSNFTDMELDFGRVNGKLNAIPIALNTETIYFNKDMYDKYGLELPTNFEDYFEAAKVMEKDGIYPIGMGDKGLFFFCLSYLEQTTGRAACDENGNLTLTKDDIVIMLQFYKRLFDEKVIEPIEKHDFTHFTKGKVAGVMGWVSDATMYCQPAVDKGVNVVVGDFPKINDNVEHLGWYVKPATMYAISANTEQPVAAAKLLDFLLNSREMALLQKTEKGVPISKNAKEVLVSENILEGLTYDANENITKYSDKLSKMETILESDNVYGVFKNEADYYLYDRNTLDEVAESLYNKFYS